jgi:hypothetical protein
MQLKISINSVSGELDTERRALEGTIRKLDELYVGMDYFGSNPRCAFRRVEAACPASQNGPREEWSVCVNLFF